jgi:ribosomal protein S27AE
MLYYNQGNKERIDTMYNRYCPKCGSPNIIDDDVFDIDYQWEHDKIIAKVSATCTDCWTPITYKTHFKFDKYSDFEAQD